MILFLATKPARPGLMARRCAALAALFSLALAPACDPGERDDRLELEELPSPAAEGSGEPFLATAPDGRILLSWLEPVGEEMHALRFSVLGGDGWTEPATIASGGDFFVNWADFPSILALGGERLVAHWLVRSGPGTYSYDVHLATSDDFGRTWSRVLVPHTDGTETEHGFASLFPEDGGTVGAIWLDGRNFASAGAGHGDGHGGAEMTLRYASIRPEALADEGVADTALAGRALAAEALLDGRVCDCCQTSVAITAEGPVAVYRDRDPDEVRDISIVRQVEGAWSSPAPVHRDGWRIPACPVNGPAVVAEGRRVAVAWFTAAADTPRVRVAFSEDAGASFGEPIRIDGGAPEGRVDLALLADGDVAVTWLERVGAEEAEIRLRRVSPADGAGAWSRVAGSSAARASGFPRVVRSGDRLIFAWTQPGAPARIRVAAASAGAL